MHDMVEWIAGSVICCELQYHEPSWGLIPDDVRAKRCGEHVIQLSIDGIGQDLGLLKPLLVVVLVDGEASLA